MLLHFDAISGRLRDLGLAIGSGAILSDEPPITLFLHREIGGI